MVDLHPSPHPESLSNHKLLGFPPRLSDSGGGAWNMHFYQFPADADAAGLGPHFEDHICGRWKKKSKSGFCAQLLPWSLGTMEWAGTS